MTLITKSFSILIFANVLVYIDKDKKRIESDYDSLAFICLSNLRRAVIRPTIFLWFMVIYHLGF